MDMRQPKIRVRRYKDSNRPHLKFVVNYREAGKRKRTFFETRDAANSFAVFKNDELKRNGIEGVQFPTALRVMAQHAVEQLRPFGKTITDAVQHYVEHLKASERSCTATHLVEKLFAAKKADGIGERHLRGIRLSLGKFADAFNGKMVAEITTKDIDDWLRSLNVGRRTRNHYRQHAVAAFNFAKRQGYAPSNPAEGATVLKV